MNNWRNEDTRKLNPGEQPGIWSLEGKNLKVTIHRIRNEEDWFLSVTGLAALEKVRLKAPNLKAAKAEGLEHLVTRMQELRDEAAHMSRVEVVPKHG